MLLLFVCCCRMPARSLTCLLPITCESEVERGLFCMLLLLFVVVGCLPGVLPVSCLSPVSLRLSEGCFVCYCCCLLL